MILRLLRRLLKLLKGDPVTRFSVSEAVSRRLSPNHFYGEYGKVWLDECLEFLPFEPEERPSLARRWDRLWVLHQYASNLPNVSGAFVEFGVYRGDSARVLLAADPTSVYWGIDSFEGLSRPRFEVDGRYWEEGDLAVSQDVVAGLLSPWSERITLIRGWIPTVLSSLQAIEAIRLAHIDVDLYEPTAASLEYVKSRMSPGGVIICDDYGFETCPGARSAIDSFIGRNAGWRLLHLPTGQAVLIKSHP